MKKLLSHTEIQNRIAELAEKISKDFKGQHLIAVCVLKGAVFFYADLIRQLECEVTLDFVKLGSYGNSDSHRGETSLLLDLEADIRGKNVLIVEDIVDTGNSMNFLMELLSGRRPAKLKLCTLIDKDERREVSVAVDYFGFQLDKGFVVGYGLDYAQKYRNLRSIYEVTFD